MSSVSTADVSIADIQFNGCSLTYGESPCTASVGVTGADRCYELFAQCQDQANYDPEDRTLRFAMTTAPVIPGLAAYYKMTGIQPAIGSVDLQGGVGGLTRIKIQIQDWEDEDLDDPYRSLRSTIHRAPFWPRFLQRMPYLKGRHLVIREGSLEQDGTLILSALPSRTYVIEEVNLSSSTGMVDIVARDHYGVLDDTYIPAPSNVSLAAAMDDSQTTATVDSGQGDELGTAPFWIQVGTEIMKVGGRTGDSLSSIDRAQAGSEAETHDDGDGVQLGLVWEDVDASQVFEDIHTEAGLDASDVDTAGAAAEISRTTNGDFPVTAYWMEPTKALEVLGFLMRSIGAYSWMDPEVPIAYLRMIRPRYSDETVETLDDQLIVGDTVMVDQQERRRITRELILYGVRNWAEGLEKTDNYSHRAWYIDGVEESANGFGAVKQRKAVYCPFATEDRTQEMVSRAFRAVDTSKRIRRIKAKLPRVAAESHPVGGQLDIETYRLRSETGEVLTSEAIVVSKGWPKAGGTEFAYEFETTALEGDWWEWTDDDGETAGTQWADDDGEVSAGVPGKRWV